MYYIGFDVGGSKIRAVLVKGRKIIRSRVEKTPVNLANLLNWIQKTVENFGRFSPKGKIAAIGLAVAGALDSKRERVLISPNIPYLHNQPLKKLLKRKLKRPVVLEHDVHALLWAESKLGLARQRKNVFCLTLGTGIGSAFMTDGKIIKGSHGAAGEAGHMILDIKRNLDLEKLAASEFLKKKMGRDYGRTVDLALVRDKKAVAALRELGRNLCLGIANIINIFDPEAIILAGGISRGRKFIEPGIRAAIKKFVVSPEAKKTQILWSRLGDTGGALGAALMLEESRKRK